MRQVLEKVKSFLVGRKQAYQITFNLENKHDKEVLADLAKFCRAHDTTFHPDARLNSVLEGRREVWLRIQQHLNLSSDDLWELYSGKPKQ